MALMGRGAMVFWHDISPTADEADFHRWHSIEHMPERIGVPGFRRGRRCATDAGGQRFFIMYEVDDLSVLTSAPYLARLNDPSPWTSKSIATFRDSNRTLCRVMASVGHGVGSVVLTIRFSAKPEKEVALATTMAKELLPGLLERPGVIGAHLLKGDPKASQTETAEKQLRDKPDDVADWVLIAEGYDWDGVMGLRDGVLYADRLADFGIEGEQTVDSYRLLHALAEADL